MLLIKNNYPIKVNFNIFEIIKFCEEEHMNSGDLPYVSFTDKFSDDVIDLLEFTEIGINRLLPIITQLRNILTKELLEKGLLTSTQLDDSNESNKLRDNGICCSKMVSFDFYETGKCFISDIYGVNDIIISVKELESFSLDIKYLL
jgi:hypothetical protein